MARELEDRFGPPPEEVRNLLYLLHLKVVAMQAHLSAINVENGRVVIKFGQREGDPAGRLSARFDGRVKVARDRAWLEGPESGPMWRKHLLDVVSALIDSNCERNLGDRS
jgi:transcription-repair coupling factor (superfamily II helicase)